MTTTTTRTTTPTRTRTTPRYTWRATIAWNLLLVAAATAGHHQWPTW